MPFRVGVHLDAIFTEAALGIVQRAVDQFLQLLDAQRFELKNLRARNQGAVHVEERIVCRSADQAQIAALHIRQKNVLLRLVEVMNFVNEQNSSLTRRSKAIRGPCHHTSHLGDVAFHSAQPLEFGAGHVRDDLCERCFAGAGRAGEDDGRQPIGFNRAPQEFSRREDVLLPDEFLQGSRPHAGSQGRRGGGGRPFGLLVALKQIVHEQKYGAQIGLHIIFARMRKVLWIISLCLITLEFAAAESRLPFGTVFKGRDRFDRLVSSARNGNWRSLPIGERTATVGRALVGTRYKSFTLEIDNRVEAPSVNFIGMDCWTFYEIALAFARMLDEPAENWTPERLLHYIELDRYRGGQCTGEYLSRLHYLEDWLADNDRRGLVEDLTRSLGGVSVPHSAREMTVAWRHYRYLAANRSLLGPLRQMEARVSSRPLYQIPKSRVASIEGRLRSGDIIGIISRDGRNLYSTSHVGLALRVPDGSLHFMHASSPRNYGRVVIDSTLSSYLYRYRTDSGILVARPLR